VSTNGVEKKILVRNITSHRHDDTGHPMRQVVRLEHSEKVPMSRPALKDKQHNVEIQHRVGEGSTLHGMREASLPCRKTRAKFTASDCGMLLLWPV